MTSARTIGLALLLFACTCGIFLACGGGVAGDGTPAADGGPFDAATSADAKINPTHDAMPMPPDADVADATDAALSDGAPRVPANHRPVAVPCPMQRGPGNTGGLPRGDCDADTDCTGGANGRCLGLCGPPGCAASFCDCGPGGYCSPSGTAPWCNRQYYCHTALDTCLDDSDCAPGTMTGMCSFQPTLGHWACGPFCTPPA
jgi:hypothetical protein